MELNYQILESPGCKKKPCINLTLGFSLGFCIVAIIILGILPTYLDLYPCSMQCLIGEKHIEDNVNVYRLFWCSKINPILTNQHLFQLKTEDDFPEESKQTVYFKEDPLTEVCSDRDTLKDFDNIENCTTQNYSLVISRICYISCGILFFVGLILAIILCLNLYG